MPILVSLMLASSFAASGPSEAEVASADLPAVWAGHHVTLGSRRVPFKGKVVTRTDAFVLARVRRSDRGRLEIVQRTCRVKFRPVGGVKISMDGAELPASTLRLTDDGEGALRGRTVVQWNERDIDGDDNPGMTVHVEARVCSGDLYVANRSVTEAKARLVDGKLLGTAKVQVTQSILGARGACLSVVASDTNERQHGKFAFAQVADDATCESLGAEPWPVKAS